MPNRPTYDGLNPFDDPVDRILAEIAFSLQLPPSLRAQAEDRYGAVRRHLEDSTGFTGLIEHFYPQGSMAIDATISTRGTDDEYDLDIVAQLGGRFRTMQPLDILLELASALEDYPVRSVRRQTRCVTLDFADRMHLDITPALRVWDAPDRESFITHAKGPKPAQEDRLVDMNAYGFATWYEEQTPIERRVMLAYDQHWRELETGVARADAEVDDIPEAVHFVVKNTATLALQLLKRARNIRYANATGRISPSVMHSFYAARAAQPNIRLSDMVIRIASWMIRDIEEASMRGRKLHVANPVNPKDVFTDRWPGSLEQQNDYANHLKDLVAGLQQMREHRLSADAIGEWLRHRFGDRVVTKAADRMARDVGHAVRHATHGYGKTGRLVLPTRGLGIGTAAASLLNPAVPARAHTFYGIRL